MMIQGVLSAEPVFVVSERPDRPPPFTVMDNDGKAYQIVEVREAKDGTHFGLVVGGGWERDQLPHSGILTIV